MQNRKMAAAMFHVGPQTANKRMCPPVPAQIADGDGRRDLCPAGVEHSDFPGRRAQTKGSLPAGR
jgi:hypothetical protein